MPTFSADHLLLVDVSPLLPEPTQKSLPKSRGLNAKLKHDKLEQGRTELNVSVIYF